MKPKFEDTDVEGEYITHFASYIWLAFFELNFLFRNHIKIRDLSYCILIFCETITKYSTSSSKQNIGSGIALFYLYITGD